MSGLKGIAKNLTASLSSHLVAVLQQLVLTPLFLHNYGAAGFGQWLTLSASVSYLGTLDFGIQTFVNQDLTLRYNRGDMAGFHIQQSTALRMLLGIVIAVSTFSLLVFKLPLEHWLRMDVTGSAPRIPTFIVRGTIFLLAQQVLISILFGFFAGQFLVLGRAHIGLYWSNLKNAAQILFAIPCLLLHTNFFVIAAAQLAALFLCLCGTLITLHRIGRPIFPTLRHWDRTAVPRILGPSGYFALIFSSNFLVYQAPVLILERTAGPIAVAIFSITRTIFSMTRNVINAFTQAIGPEVTILYARGDWPCLTRLYDFSERLIFALIPIANISALFLCPVLLTVWLHKPQLFQPNIYVFAAAVSIVMSAKEHKFQFQFSTNTHLDLARFMFAAYVLLVAAWVLVIPRFGIAGLFSAWLTVEFTQVLYIMRLNARFFAPHQRLDRKYPIRLTALSLAVLALTLKALPFTATLPLLTQAAIAAAIGLVLFTLAVPLFTLLPLYAPLRTLLHRRLGRAA